MYLEMVARDAGTHFDCYAAALVNTIDDGNQLLHKLSVKYNSK